MKILIWVGAVVGCTVGGWFGSLLDGNILGTWSILLSTVGGIAGVYTVYKLNQRIGE